jgi:hypothetical protein
VKLLRAFRYKYLLTNKLVRFSCASTAHTLLPFLTFQAFVCQTYQRFFRWMIFSEINKKYRSLYCAFVLLKHNKEEAALYSYFTDEIDR